MKSILIVAALEMKRTLLVLITVFVVTTNLVYADTFGTGTNQFTIDFVTISGDASSANGTNISGYSPEQWGYKTFADPVSNYWIGQFEITNDQWTKFVNSYGMVTGSPSQAYDGHPYFTGASVPTNNVSWCEAAQFVNWLNTSTGHQAAYKFTGTIHTSNYTLAIWGTGDADGTNLYRNKNAYYFLPTEDEWVKAAYWNGTTLQTYATKDGSAPAAGTYSNYDMALMQPWAVGSGSEELNGTFDMMGNVREWMESPFTGDYLSGSVHGIRGGSYNDLALDYRIRSSSRSYNYPHDENRDTGFRIASVPEPTSLLLLAAGGLLLRRRV